MKKGHNIYLKTTLLFALICISYNFSFAQVTTLRGIVKDASTDEPIEYALIHFENTSTGVYSQKDGSFVISQNSNKPIKVKIQAMGYEDAGFFIPIGETTSKEVLMNRIDKLLTEVIINPKKGKYSKKDNPAVELIKKVIANKHKNNITAQDYYQYKEYERYIFAFNDFKPESGIFKKYKFLPNYVDTSITNHKAILPFSVKEKVTDVFYRKNPKSNKRIVKGQKTEGIDQTLDQQGIEVIIEETFQTVNIFDNYITMLQNNFVSPLSEHQAVSFYKWYLGDTITIRNDRYVRLDFGPFNNRDLGFTGNLYISLDGTYAVKKAILNVPKNLNVNFVDAMVIHQDFKKDESGIWVPEEYRTAIDFSFYNALQLYVDKTVTVEDFIANIPLAFVYDLSSPEIFEKDYQERPDEFWSIHRPVQHKTDYRIDELVNEMKDQFLVKLILNAGDIMMSGYIPLDKDKNVNKLEIGTIPTFYSYNYTEGNRIKLTFNTTKNLHPHLFFNGYGAYGTRDRKFKYSGEATWAFNPVKNYKNDFPSNNLSVGYSYDMNALGERFTQSQRDNIFRSFSRSKSSKMTYSRQVNMNYIKEYHGGFSFRLSMINSNEVPAQGITFEKQDEQGNKTIIPNMKVTEAGVTLRYVHNEKFVQRRKRRMVLPTEIFVVELKNTTAIKDFLGGQYNFNKTSLNVAKSLWVTPYGKLNLSVEGQKLWGTAPFISLVTPNANSSFTLQSGSFYLLEPLEFVHDQQVSWEVYYHLGGWLFNRIPLLKYLKWREVFGFRGFYGSLNKKNDPNYNHDLIRFPEDQSFQTKGGKPYMEYNVGIENIFNFFRIDYVRRVNYLYHPGIDKDGFRISFQMEF